MEQLLIKIPHYMKREFIYSEPLRKALAEANLIGYLRTIFKEDSQKFYDLRDELLLRAFEFSAEVRSNYFPALLFEPQQIIIVNKNSSLYTNLPVGVIGIEHLLRRYEVRNDYFFNYVSIEGISYMLKKDVEFVKLQFKGVGFDIVTVNEVEKLDLNKRDVMPNVMERSSLVEQALSDVALLAEEPNEQEHDQLAEPNGDHTTIDDIFPGRKFLAFQNYCIRENIGKISDLTIDAIENFQYEKGVGNKKYLLVKEQYAEYMQEYAPKEEERNETKQLNLTGYFYYFQQNAVRRLLERNKISYTEFLDGIYNKLSEESFVDYFKQEKERVKQLAKEEKRQQLEEIGKVVSEQIRQHVHYPFFEQFTWNQCAKLLNLEKLHIDTTEYFFEFITNEEYFESLPVVLNSLDAFVPLREKCAALRKEFSDRAIFILTVRNQNQSLEAVGNQVSLTRERVRQIEKKNYEKIKLFLERNHLSIIIRHFLSESPRLSLDELLKLLKLEAEDEFLLHTYLKGNKQFIMTDGYIADAEFKLHMDKVLQMLLVKGQDIYQVEDVVYYFQQTADYEISMLIIHQAMESINFYRKNDLYIKKTVKLPSLIQYLFKHKIPSALEMTDENFELMQRLMQETFGMQFENGKRAAVARFRDTENVILVNGNTFMYFYLEAVPQQLILEISEKLELALAQDGQTSAMTLFKTYEDVWQKYDIQTHFHLYSIIHYFFKDDYDIGQGNTLVIREIGVERLDASMILERYLEEHGTSTKKEICDALKWPAYKTDQVIFRYPKFHQVELDDGAIGIMLFADYGFEREELETIKRFYEDFVDQDYIFVQELKTEMEFDDEVTEILAEKNIVKLYDFASLLKGIDPDLRGFHQLVYKKGSKYNRLEPVVAKEFPTIFTRKELEDYYVDKGYALSGLTSLIASLVDEQFFYPYTSYQHINAKLVHFSEESLRAVKAYLDEVFADKEYMSALDLTGYTQLPSFGQYDWTVYLIAHLAPQLGYYVINTTRDYRYNKLLLVKKELQITEYDALVHKAIREEYEGDYYVQDVANFLVQKKLSHSPVFNYELKESPIFSVNDYGYITIKGE